LRAGQGWRVVLLATSVAETGVTLYVDKVIDTSYRRVLDFKPKQRKLTWTTRSLTKAESEQRSGRVGRVSTGVYFQAKVDYSPYVELEKTQKFQAYLWLKLLGFEPLVETFSQVSAYLSSISIVGCAQLLNSYLHPAVARLYMDDDGYFFKETADVMHYYCAGGQKPLFSDKAINSNMLSNWFNSGASDLFSEEYKIPFDPQSICHSQMIHIAYMMKLWNDNYLPSSRPLRRVAAYEPGAFPDEEEVATDWSPRPSSLKSLKHSKRDSENSVSLGKKINSVNASVQHDFEDFSPSEVKRSRSFSTSVVDVPRSEFITVSGDGIEMDSRDEPVREDSYHYREKPTEVVRYHPHSVQQVRSSMNSSLRDCPRYEEDNRSSRISQDSSRSRASRVVSSVAVSEIIPIEIEGSSEVVLIQPLPRCSDHRKDWLKLSELERVQVEEYLSGHLNVYNLDTKARVKLYSNYCAAWNETAIDYQRSIAEKHVVTSELRYTTDVITCYKLRRRQAKVLRNLKNDNVRIAQLRAHHTTFSMLGYSVEMYKPVLNSALSGVQKVDNHGDETFAKLSEIRRIVIDTSLGPKTINKRLLNDKLKKNFSTISLVYDCNILLGQAVVIRDKVFGVGHTFKGGLVSLQLYDHVESYTPLYIDTVRDLSVGFVDMPANDSNLSLRAARDREYAVMLYKDIALDGTMKAVITEPFQVVNCGFGRFIYFQNSYAGMSGAAVISLSDYKLIGFHVGVSPTLSDASFMESVSQEVQAFFERE